MESNSQKMVGLYVPFEYLKDYCLAQDIDCEYNATDFIPYSLYYEFREANGVSIIPNKEKEYNLDNEFLVFHYPDSNVNGVLTPLKMIITDKEGSLSKFKKHFGKFLPDSYDYEKNLMLIVGSFLDY